MATRSHLRILATTLLLASTFAFYLAVSPVRSEEPSLYDYVGAKAELFADPEAAVESFRSKLSSDNFDGVAQLLGLDPARLARSEDIKGNFEAIRERASKLFTVENDGDRRIILLGDEVWPFPFPLTKKEGGKWAFDTQAGIEEIINRRVGENELEAIKTVQGYVDGQEEYASKDRDDDGVLEFAQKLISTAGQTDGLYWPSDDDSSPAGGLVDEQELRKAKDKGSGYFGYRFRILTGQGNNVAGGRYSYIINGNMIAGFALVAWPVRYGETGVSTFLVNQAGVVYQKDLGPKTEAIVSGITVFDPDKSWDIVTD